MQVMFRSGQELVKVGEIGELIVEADCAFRFEIVKVVLAELRSDWEKLPLRDVRGFKHRARGLSALKQSMHDRAMRYAESRAYAKTLEIDAAIDALGIELKGIQQKEIRGGIAGPSMQMDIDSVKLRIKNLQLLKAHHLQEAQEEALEKNADNMDAFVREEYVRVSELAAWLRAEHGIKWLIKAVTEGTAPTNTRLPDEAQEQTGTVHSGAPEVAPADGDEQSEAATPAAPEKTAAARSGATRSASLLAKQDKLSKIIKALESYAAGANLPFDPKAMPGPLGDHCTEEGSFHWLCAKLDRDFMKAKNTFESYRAGICALQKYAKKGDFYRRALPHIQPIFISRNKADQKSKRQ